MSGGGKTSDIPASMTAAQAAQQQASSGGSGGGQTSRTFPAAMPGQLEAIASQINAGYGTPVPDVMSYLQSIYKPVSVADQMKDTTKKSSTPQPAAGDYYAKLVQPALGYQPNIVFKGDIPYMEIGSSLVPATLEQALMRR